MGTFLLFLLVIFFTIIILGLTFLRGIVKLFIRRPSNNGQQRSSGYREYQNNNNSEQSNNHQKVFTKNEGEYVDFEDIKV